jgi:hypothetical protein
MHHLRAYGIYTAELARIYTYRASRGTLVLSVVWLSLFGCAFLQLTQAKKRPLNIQHFTTTISLNVSACIFARFNISSSLGKCFLFYKYG